MEQLSVENYFIICLKYDGWKDETSYSELYWLFVIHRGV